MGEEIQRQGVSAALDLTDRVDLFDGKFLEDFEKSCVHNTFRHYESKPVGMGFPKKHQSVYINGQGQEFRKKEKEEEEGEEKEDEEGMEEEGKEQEEEEEEEEEEEKEEEAEEEKEKEEERRKGGGEDETALCKYLESHVFIMPEWK
ncbi:hypothetical protein STEG23_017346 [Scotinomys teguina]